MKFYAIKKENLYWAGNGNKWKKSIHQASFYPKFEHAQRIIKHGNNYLQYYVTEENIIEVFIKEKQ